MPIKPEHRHHYRGVAWRAARALVLERAGHACECLGECGDDHAGGRCNLLNELPIVRDPEQPARWRHHPRPDQCPRLDGCRGGCRGVVVVLTVAHLDHDPGNNDPERLRAFCQRCHLRYDRHEHGKNAAATRRRKRLEAERAAGQGEMPWKGS